MSLDFGTYFFLLLSLLFRNELYANFDITHLSENRCISCTYYCTTEANARRIKENACGIHLAMLTFSIIRGQYNLFLSLCEVCSAIRDVLRT